MSRGNKFLQSYIILKMRFVEFFEKNLITNLNLVSTDNFVRIPLFIDKLWTFDPVLTKKLLKNPINYISIIDHAAYTVYKNFIFSDQNEKIIIKSNIEGPFGNRICYLKNLRATFIGEIICIKGLVVKYTEIKIKIEQSVHFSSKTGKFFVNEFNNSKSNNCWYYLFKDENMNDLETEYGLCKFVNWQNILLQDYSRRYHEKKTNDTICAVLENDLINTCTLGKSVELCGIYSPFVLSKFHFESDFFSPALFVLSVKNSNKISGRNLNQFDYFLMKNFSLLANNFQRLSTLIAPRIFGQSFTKKGILLFIAGEGLTRIQYPTQKSTNINLLLFGQSQKTTSELLFFISKLIPSSIFLEGGVFFPNVRSKKSNFDSKKEQINRLFFVDKKILCINHFEKISQNEKKIFKEIIDQQTISVEKNSLLLSLKARCNVLGLTNSFMNLEDNSIESKKNIELTNEILRRFDLKLFLLENISEKYDKKIASIIIKQHQNVRSFSKIKFQNIKSEKSVDMKNFFYFSKKKKLKTKKSAPLPFYFFKIYIHFLKKNIKPIFSTNAGNFLLRNYKKIKETKPSGILFCIRHFEILIKLAYAITRCHLRSVVSEKDMNFCCSFFLKSIKSEQRITEKEDEYFSHRKYKRKKKIQQKGFISILAQKSKTNNEKDKIWKIIYKKKSRIDINFRKMTHIGLEFHRLKHLLTLKKNFSVCEKFLSIILEKKYCFIYRKKIIKI